MTDRHEVLVVGAGPGGSAAAYFLAAQGLDVLLVDRSDFPRDKTCGDGLSPRALSVLRAMGLLPTVADAGFRINRVRIVAPDGTHLVSPIPPHDGHPEFSLVVPRYTLDEIIRAHAVAAGATFRPRVTATDVLRDGDRIVGVRATAPDGPIDLGARVTVLATGASTALLERARLLASPPVFGRAARGYFEGVAELSDEIEFDMQSVPLPGYGWVFPISSTAANVGAGFIDRPGRPAAFNSPRPVFDEFLANARQARRLADARTTGPVKSYPLRIDFPSARVAFPGLVLVGEAGGLVNPLTGEGIDYALESAQLAAEALGDGLRRGWSPEAIAERHAQAMRDRFLRTFKAIARVRDVYFFQPWVLNHMAAAANRDEGLKITLVQIALGNVDPSLGLSPKTLLQIALG